MTAAGARWSSGPTGALAGMSAVALVERTPLRPSSDRQTRATLARMARFVEDRASDPTVRAWAEQIVEGARVRDVAGQVQALRTFLQDRVRFLADPVADELVHDPVLLLGRIASVGEARGDCDDVATLAATLAQSIGIPARFVAVAFGGPFVHVYTEVWTGERWEELDTTREVQDAERLRSQSRRLTVPLYGASGATAGLRGLGFDVSTFDPAAPGFGLDTNTWLWLGGGVAAVLLLVLARR